MDTQKIAPKVYIVILNWNGWRDTIECLETVFRLNYTNFQIVICDNDSQDGSVEKIVDWTQGFESVSISSDHPLHSLSFPNIAKPIKLEILSREQAESTRKIPNSSPIALIKTGGNLGFAGGNNVGLRYVLQQNDADYVWLLNNDTVVEVNALAAMVEECQKKSQNGKKYTCGSMVCFYQEPKIIQALGGSKFNYWTGVASQTLGRFKLRTDNIDHDDIAKSLDYITGCTWLIPVQFLKDIGLMEEKYFLYYEEIDWVTRSGNKYQITYAHDSIVYHKEGSSIGSKTLKRAPSLLAEHYMARSKVLFMRRFFPMSLPVVYVMSMLQALNRVRQGYKKNGWILVRAIFGRPRLP